MREFKNIAGWISGGTLWLYWGGSSACRSVARWSFWARGAKKRKTQINPSDVENSRWPSWEFFGLPKTNIYEGDCCFIKVHLLNNWISWFSDCRLHICCVPEMVGPIFLAKATARYEADSRFLQHLHAIKHVWLLSLFLRERKGNNICTNLDNLVAWGSLTKSYTYNRKLWGYMLNLT